MNPRFSVIDGGLSTAIEELGGDVSGRLWTAALAATDPGLLTDAHRSFVEAGAEVISTASYQCDATAFEELGLTVAEGRHLLSSMTDLARRACAETNVKVAVSVGPFGASLADGSEYTGRYGVPWSVIAEYHRRKLAVLVDSGADLVAVETIPLAEEARLIADLLTELGSPPAWFSFGGASADRTYGGDDLSAASAGIVDYDGLIAVGVNCTAPSNVSGALVNIGRSTPDVPLIAYPNHGRTWNAANRIWDGSEPNFESDWSIAEWVAAGAQFIGGCCGVGPAGIARISARRSVD